MNKKISIDILVHSTGSFFQQGLNLSAGFNKLNYRTNIISITKESKKEAYKKCKDDLIISIGSWRHWSFLYRELAHHKKLVLPWLVSDDKVLDYVKEINRIPVLLVPSRFCQYTFERAGVRKEIIQIIPEGIDTDFWKPVSRQEVKSLRSLLVLFKEEGSTILLTIGGDGTSKGAQEVLSALKELPSLNILYFIKIWGFQNGFFMGLKERKLIDRFNLTDKVSHIMGHFSNQFIRNLINLCDIYIAPSRHEGFGLPHAQAMACSKPVITCQGTAAEETSVDRVTGYIVPSQKTKWKNAEGYIVEGVKGDILELKKAIKNLTQNPKLREIMGRNARRHVIENYESKRIAQLFLDKIKDLLS